MHQPEAVQHETFSLLMKNLAATRYGREHGASENMTYSSFSERLPIATYEALESYIEEMRLGAADVLWPGVTKWFARSSGTTGSKR